MDVRPGDCDTGEQQERPRLLIVGGRNDKRLAITDRLGEVAEVVRVYSPMRALTMLASGKFAGVYADAEHFSESFELGRMMQNDRVLRAMPEAVVLVNPAGVIIWGNGRLAAWTNRKDLVGANFYEVLGDPELVGQGLCPIERAFACGESTVATLRSAHNNRYYRTHFVPVIEGEEHAHHLVISLRDVTDEVLQQQKLEAIHQAGIELADLTADEVASMNVDERIEILKENIRRSTHDVLNYDVVEVRTLDKVTGELIPLLADGMQAEAEQRVLFAKPESNGVTGHVAYTGKSYLCEDTSRDQLYLSGARDARSSLTVPLMLHDEVIGTINVESPEAQGFGPSDLQFLEIFSRELAVALNTLQLLAVEKVSSTAASVEAIHSAVAKPVDEILNDVVTVIEQYANPDPAVAERLTRVLRNARDIKRMIHDVGQTMAPVEARPASGRGNERPSLSGRRVLVVDSEESVRSDAHDLLEKHLCTVETSHNGNDAICMVRNLAAGEHYDTIVADITLPDMTAHDLLTRLKPLVGDVPLMLMAGFGYDGGHTIVKCKREGVKFVVYKPLKEEQFLDAVEHMVDPGAFEQ